MEFREAFIMKLLPFVIVCCVIFYGLSIVLQQPDQEKKTQQVSRVRYSKPRMEINGLEYNLSSMGEPNFLLKADRFRLRKKKFGFIRFGLAQEASFENAEMSFFYNSTLPASGTSDSTLAAAGRSDSNFIPESPEYASIFSLGETLTASHSKRISAA